MRVFLNGKFDLLTPAHYNLLQYARDEAGVNGQVMVAIDTDDRIAKTDPMLPIFPLHRRMEHLKMLQYMGQPLIDQVTIFQTDEDLIQIIQTWKPDWMVKGEDWMDKPVIGMGLVKIKWYPLHMGGMPLKVSSSDFIKAILQNYHDKRGI
jgi:cytidyltransferase-like protein